MNRIKISDQQLFALVALILGFLTFAIYWPVWGDDFISADDTAYITQSPHIYSGLSLANVRWALTSTEQANWHPLTWISHMLDCQLFGLQPGAHHMVNVLFHIADSLLLLVLLKDATGAFWRSVLVAALFAWHPMHVESVAWASERKDVLSTFFWLLSLIAYVSYARKPRPSAYILSLVFFIGGLMSKPMVVTLPFVLLLLDWWPLHRVARANLQRLVLEKIPFFVLTMASCVITYVAQQSGGAVSNPGWLLKIGNAAVAYLGYVSKLIYPINLAMPYSHPVHREILWPCVAVLVLAVWTLLAVMKAKQKPYFVIGWFYFLGTLVPTIGLVQVGSQSMADRYVYIPSIGLFIVLVWGIQDLIKSQPNQKFIATVCSTASLAVCLLLCKPQIAAWQNSITLYSRALRAEPENYLAYDWLGAAVRDAGAPQQALDLFLESVKLEPHYNPAEKDLAVQLLSAGRVDEALDHLRTAVALDPADPGAQQNLGVILVTHGKIEEGIPHFEKALALEPYSTEIINQLAWIYATGGQPKYRNGARAVQLARDACQRTQNNDSFSLRTLAVAYAETGDFTNAQATLEKARIMAVTHQKASTLKDMPAIQQAINSNQPYRDPTLN